VVAGASDHVGVAGHREVGLGIALLELDELLHRPRPRLQGLDERGVGGIDHQPDLAELVLRIAHAAAS
jgi:hypothetical protein